jgi:uncharacterized cupin superfamily protein
MTDRPSEAPLEETAGALAPGGPGWFVVNVADALAQHHPTAGKYVPFENRQAAPFDQFGINIHVLNPGEPNAKYHAENAQEAFLVLDGECTLIVEGEERTLRKWDFFHCAPMTRHVLVGAGDGPCAILMVGTRFDSGDEVLEYPASELAAKYGAEAPEPTNDGKEAYSDWSREFTPGRLGWPVDR